MKEKMKIYTLLLEGVVRVYHLYIRKK